MGTRAEATCASRRGRGRAWRVRRDQEGGGPGSGVQGRRRWGGVDQSAAQKGGATVGRSATLQSGPAAAAGEGLTWATVVRRAGGGNDGGGATRRRRPEGVPSSPLPFHGNPKSGFPGPLSWSHGEVTLDYRFSLLHSKKPYTILPPLFLI